MKDTFNGAYSPVQSPASNGFAITPNDSSAITFVSRAIYVGTGGNIKVTLAGDSAPITFIGVPSGSMLPIRVSQVFATGTTATNMLALF